jgi:hypothetical protein
MEDLTCYISFSDAQKRYEIKQAALSYRIKSLGLKTTRKGRNTLLTLNHISLLDDLDKFLKENTGRTIDEFLFLQKTESSSKNQSTTDDLPITEALNSDTSMIHQQSSDTSLINQNNTNESLMNPDLTQIKNQINLILQAISRLEGTADTTNELLINKQNCQERTDKNNKITELEGEIDYLKQELKEAKEACFQWQQSYNYVDINSQRIKTELISKINECETLKQFWKDVIPTDMNFQHLQRSKNRIHLVTNMVDFTYAKNSFLRGWAIVHQ